MTAPEVTDLVIAIEEMADRVTEARCGMEATDPVAQRRASRAHRRRRRALHRLVSLLASQAQEPSGRRRPKGAPKK